MNDIQELFYFMLRMALGQEYVEIKELSKDDWMALYKLAERHTVLGVCLAGLEIMDKQGQKPPQPLLLQWIGVVQQVESRNKIVNQRGILMYGWKEGLRRWWGMCKVFVLLMR